VKNEAAFQKQLVKIGEKLAELRKKKGYTSHETFAYDHDLSRVQYWRIEKGKSNGKWLRILTGCKYRLVN
jgi:transcriptional regulator with XRE-family HTH domain